jgi:hypothetical protein
MEVGLAHGLAQSMQYDQRIADERYYQQQMKRAQAESIAKLDAFEKDNEYMNASNSYDRGLIDAEAKKTLMEIAQIAKNDPNWESNPESRRLINEKRRHLKSNDNVIRGMQSDAEYKKFLADYATVAKNPQMHDTEAYQKVMNQWRNYEKFGHQDGEEGLKRDGGARAFVYDKPEDFIDLPTTAIEIGNKYKSDIYAKDGSGGYRQLIDETTLRPLAENLYNQRKRQIQVQHGVKTDEEGVRVAADMIRAGIKLEHKFAEPNHALIAAQWKYKMDKMEADAASKGKTIDAYNATFRDVLTSAPNPKMITEMIGITPSVKVYNGENNYVGDVTGREFVPSGTYIRAKTVGRVAPYRTKDGRISEYAPISNDDTGVIHGWSVYNEDEIEKTGWLDDPKMEKNIEVRTFPSKWKDGETVKKYYVKSQHVFNPDRAQAYAFKFNEAVGETPKQITEMEPVNNIPTKEIEYHSDGTMWDAQTKQYLGKYK